LEGEYLMSNARDLADIAQGTAGKVVGYDDTGDVTELETQREEDDYIADEMIDMEWSK
jgi:hypothetical protein